MKAKYKMTGCARFLIFLLFLIPIAFFGSKYLRDSGTWDKIKEKVESNDRNSVERTLDEKKERIDLPINDSAVDDSELKDRYERLREAYEEQELILAKQEQTIKNLQQENGALRKRLNEPLTGNTQPTSSTTSSDRPSGTSTSPSIEDLLKEADKNLGTSSDNSGTQKTDRNRITLGEWDFNYSESTGIIEFYRQDGQLFSRITMEGDNRINIDELTRSGDRFNVQNSQTGEFYVLLNNGNLEAHDRNGYQTTCTRK